MSGKFRRTGYFYQAFIPIVLLGTCLILGFIGYIYRATYQTVQENLLSEKVGEARQIRNGLEQQVRIIEYSYASYSSTNSFAEIVDEKLDYHDYQTVHQVSSELNYLEALGLEHTEYALVSLAHKWKIENDSLLAIDELEKAELLRVISDTTTALHWQPQSGGIQMIIALPVFQQTRTAVGTALIKDSLIAQISNEGEHFFYLANAKGEHLYHNTQNLPAGIQQALAKTSAVQGNLSAKNGDLYHFLRSDYNQWVYVTRLEKQLVVAALRPIQLGFSVLAAFLIILLLIGAFIFASRLNQPFYDIQKRLQRSPSPTPKKLIIPDLMQDIESVVLEKNQLAVLLQNQKNELETLFQLELFRQVMPDAFVAEKLAQFGYAPTKNAQYVTMLIQIDSLGKREAVERDVLLLAICKFIEDLVPTNRRMTPVVLDSKTQATLLFFETGKVHQAELQGYCQDIQKQIQHYLGITVNIGLSAYYEHLGESSEALMSAREALHFRMHLGTQAIIFYDEIAAKLNTASVMRYPQEAENELFDCLRTGETLQVEPLFSTLLAEIFATNHNPIAIETAVLRLSNNLVQLAQLLGVDLALLHNNRRFYYAVLQSDHQAKIHEMVYQHLILPIAQTSQQQALQESRLVSDKVLKMIHHQYDQVLSLDIVADTLHYNPSYLSSVFKKELGTNFGDYLLEYRLKMAKKWLQESSMTVKDISERLQYTNPQNFIRFFKKKEGMTPGEFRKLNL
jgi:AraC-like DNA-binding protein